MHTRMKTLMAALCSLLTLTAVAAETVLCFSGKNSYVDLKTPDALQIPSNEPFTVEGWMLFNALSIRDMLYSKNRGRLSPYTSMLGFADHKLSAFDTDWRGNFAVSRQLNRWYHIAFSFDSTNMAFYLDGMFCGTTAFSFSNADAHTIKIGGYDSSSDINGSISDVRVWDHARSGLAIADNMYRRLFGTEAGLLGYWPLNEGTGSSVFDGTANASTGTIVSATWVDDTALELLTADAEFRYALPFILANLETGSTEFTNSNEVEVVDFPVPEGYSHYQINHDASPGGIEWVKWTATNTLPERLTFALPAGDSNMVFYAWFTNKADSVRLKRSSDEITFTTNSPVAKIHSALSRTIVPGETVATVSIEQLDDGSTGGESKGEPLAIGSASINCADDVTPDEPYVTLDLLGEYTVLLTLTNVAGNTATATCIVTVAQRTDPAIYVSWDGDDTAGTNWATARQSLRTALAQSTKDDTIYIKGGDYPQDTAIVMDGHPGLTILGGYAGVGTPGPTGATATVITRDSSLAAADYRRFVTASSSTMTWQRVTFKGARYNGSGGAIYLNTCDSTLIDCSVVDTYADQDAPIYGLGLYTDGGRLRMIDCTIHNNGRYRGWYHDHTYGAGVAVRNAEAWVSNTVFSANLMKPRAGACRGGGLYLENGTGVVAQCVFSNNWFSPEYQQGNIFEGAGLCANNVRSLQIHDSLFSGNGASVKTSVYNWFGNAIYLSGASQAASLKRVRMIGNCPPTGYANNSSAFHLSGGTVSLDEVTILGNNGSGVMLRNSGDLDLVNGLIAANQGHGITIDADGAATLRNVTVADNTDWGITNSSALVALLSSIVWSNAVGSLQGVDSVNYCCIAGGHAGQGNIDADPLFADAPVHNYYLKSRAGRWDPVTEEWVSDRAQPSPCIRTGDPTDPRWQLEPDPNGRRVNMGAYGGTPFASKVVLRGMMMILR